MALFDQQRSVHVDVFFRNWLNGSRVVRVLKLWFTGPLSEWNFVSCVMCWRYVILVFCHRCSMLMFSSIDCIFRLSRSAKMLELMSFRNWSNWSRIVWVLIYWLNGWSEVVRVKLRCLGNLLKICYSWTLFLMFYVYVLMLYDSCQLPCCNFLKKMMLPM